MKIIRLLTILITIIFLFPSTTKATTQPIVETVGNWNIGADTTVSGCFADVVYYQGQVIRVGFWKKGAKVSTYLIIGAAQWVTIAVGHKYPMTFQFDNDVPWSGDAVGIQLGNTHVLMINFDTNPTKFLTELSRKYLLRVFYNGAIIANLSLTDTVQMVPRLIRCQQKIFPMAQINDPFVNPETHAPQNPFAAAPQSVTLPVIVVMQGGDVFHGSSTATATGGSFSVIDGHDTCSGNFDSMNVSPTFTIPTRCSDGRVGTITVNRDPGGGSGAGTVLFENGDQGYFVYGTHTLDCADEKSWLSIGSDESGYYACEHLTGRPHALHSEVKVARDNGGFDVPATLNGAVTVNFLIDSGASDVSIPADVVLTLLRSGTVSRSDILSDQIYVLANGSKIKAGRFRLHSLTVGGVTIPDVIATTEPEDAEPLLGQSFLSRLPGWAIDNQRKILVIGK